MKKQIGILILILILAVAALAGAQQEGTRLLILVSNDDGYDSDGIRALAAAMAELGDVVVVAPQGNQGGTSQSIANRGPIQFGEAESIGNVQVWWVDATPAIVIRFALNELLKERQPDLIVSGINHGANVGDSVHYSGTIAAAREGAINGIASMAVSVGREDTDFKGAALAAVRIARAYLSIDNGPEFLNVNLPGGKITESIPVIVATKRAKGSITQVEVRDTPFRPDEKYFYMLLRRPENVEPESDLDIIRRGAISVMPLRVESVAAERGEELLNALGR